MSRSHHSSISDSNPAAMKKRVAFEKDLRSFQLKDSKPSVSFDPMMEKLLQWKKEKEVQQQQLLQQMSPIARRTGGVPSVRKRPEHANSENARPFQLSLRSYAYVKTKAPPTSSQKKINRSISNSGNASRQKQLLSSQGKQNSSTMTTTGNTSNRSPPSSKGSISQRSPFKQSVHQPTVGGSSPRDSTHETMSTCLSSVEFSQVDFMDQIEDRIEDLYFDFVEGKINDRSVIRMEIMNILTLCDIKIVRGLMQGGLSGIKHNQQLWYMFLLNFDFKSHWKTNVLAYLKENNIMKEEHFNFVSEHISVIPDDTVRNSSRISTASNTSDFQGYNSLIMSEPPKENQQNDDDNDARCDPQLVEKVVMTSVEDNMEIEEINKQGNVQTKEDVHDDVCDSNQNNGDEVDITLRESELVQEQDQEINQNQIDDQKCNEIQPVNRRLHYDAEEEIDINNQVIEVSAKEEQEEGKLITTDQQVQSLDQEQSEQQEISQLKTCQENEETVLQNELEQTQEFANDIQVELEDSLEQITIIQEQMHIEEEVPVEKISINVEELSEHKIVSESMTQLEEDHQSEESHSSCSQVNEKEVTLQEDTAIIELETPVEIINTVSQETQQQQEDKDKQQEEHHQQLQQQENTPTLIEQEIPLVELQAQPLTNEFFATSINENEKQQQKNEIVLFAKQEEKCSEDKNNTSHIDESQNEEHFPNEAKIEGNLKSEMTDSHLHSSIKNESNLEYSQLSKIEENASKDTLVKCTELLSYVKQEPTCELSQFNQPVHLPTFTPETPIYSPTINSLNDHTITPTSNPSKSKLKFSILRRSMRRKSQRYSSQIFASLFPRAASKRLTCSEIHTSSTSTTSSRIRRRKRILGLDLKDVQNDEIYISGSSYVITHHEVKSHENKQNTESPNTRRHSANNNNSNNSSQVVIHWTRKSIRIVNQKSCIFTYAQPSKIRYEK